MKISIDSNMKTCLVCAVERKHSFPTCKASISKLLSAPNIMFNADKL